ALGGAQAGQLAAGNPPVHLIAMLFGPDYGAAYRSAGRASGFGSLSAPQGELARAYGGHDHAVRMVLGAVQAAVVAGLPDARRQAMLAVLRQNYPEQPDAARFELAIDKDDWPGYVRLQSGHGHLRSLLEEVAPLYGFLSARNHTAFNNWMVDGRCPGLRHQLRRR